MSDSEKVDQDENQDEVVSLREILEDEESLEAEADAVLGACDDKVCSYPQGYVNRQALYACKTCSPTEPAAICLACSYACHEKHELYELYTKRSFRCDCGNTKFPGNKCTLFPAKEKQNDYNAYNQNFFGKYCRCKRPYPDTEKQGNDEDMHQCIICEDWYHLDHIGLGGSISTNKELTCDECMQSHKFLRKYSDSLKRLIVDAEDVKVDIETTEPASKRQKTGESACQYDSLPESENPMCGALWPEGWRTTLCTCSSCMEMYEEQKVSFLVSINDSIEQYEAEGKLKRQGRPDPLMSALDKLDHVQKMDVIVGFNDLKTSLREFLKEKADNNIVVKETDITDFFARMKAKTKSENGSSVSYFCR